MANQRTVSFPRRLAVLPLSALLLLAGCKRESVLPPLGGSLVDGTWGGENAGLIVSDSVGHAHVGCTYGDFMVPAAVDENGRFEVPGDYVLRAYPVAVGPSLPARFAGVIRGDRLTLTVAVDDTVEAKLVLLGPVSLRLGETPRLGPCPICVAAGRARVP